MPSEKLKFLPLNFQTAFAWWLLCTKCRLKSLFANGNVGSVIMATFDAKRQADLRSLPTLRRLLRQVVAIEAHVHVFHTETDTDSARILRHILNHNIEWLVYIDGGRTHFWTVRQDAALCQTTFDYIRFWQFPLPPIQ